MLAPRLLRARGRLAALTLLSAGLVAVPLAAHAEPQPPTISVDYYDGGTADVSIRGGDYSGWVGLYGVEQQDAGRRRPPGRRRFHRRLRGGLVELPDGIAGALPRRRRRLVLRHGRRDGVRTGRARRFPVRRRPRARADARPGTHPLPRADARPRVDGGSGRPESDAGVDAGRFSGVGRGRGTARGSPSAAAAATHKSLAATGTDVNPWIAGAGAMAVAVGAATLVVARRRRAD